jgi:hypothetical protein
MQTALLIFIVLFALAIGFFLGLFLLSLNSPLTKKLTKDDSGENAEDSHSPDGDPDSTESKPNPKAQLLLKVWKTEGEPPVYDVGGRYLAKEDLPKEILHVITLQEEIQPEAEIPQPEPPPEEPILASEAQLEEEEEGDEEELGKMLSVVDEVNDILQRKLVGSALAGKGIHLMENHNQEIRFWVGLNSYSDVEDIPDPEVRRIIDESVREWEQNRG